VIARENVSSCSRRVAFENVTVSYLLILSLCVQNSHLRIAWCVDMVLQGLFDASSSSVLTVPSSRPLSLMDFAASAIDFLTNVKAALPEDAFVSSTLDAFVEHARGAETESASFSFLLHHAFTFHMSVNPWRTSVFHNADWVAYYVDTWRGHLVPNAAMESVVELLSGFSGDDRSNLQSHVSNVAEQASLLFVRREVPSKRSKSKSKSKSKSGASSASSMMSQAARNTRQLFSNPAVVSRLKQTAADLIRETVPDADTVADADLINQVFEMSMGSAPAVVESMASRLNGLPKRKVKKLTKK